MRAPRSVTARRTHATEADILTVAGLLIVTFEREFNLAGLAHLAGGLYQVTGPVFDRVLGQLLRTAPVAGGGRAAPRETPACPLRIPIEIRCRPSVAHRDDDDGGPFAFLTFR